MFIYRLQQTEETSDGDTGAARGGPWSVHPFRFWLPLTKSHGCGFPSVCICRTHLSCDIPDNPLPPGMGLWNDEVSRAFSKCAVQLGG